MQFQKVRKVKTPSRGYKRSAGIDFFVPQLDAVYLLDFSVRNKDEIANDQLYIDKTEGVIILSPGAHIDLPSGICVNLTTVDGVILDDNHGIAYIAHNKSGVAKTKRLDVAATVVDEDYQGEIHLSLINTSNRLIKIKGGEKIVQFIATPIILSELIEIPESDELFNEKTDRGARGFGSSGTSDQI